MKQASVKIDQPEASGNFLTSVPGAILIGSLLISFSILMSGGIIKIKGFNAAKGLKATPAADAAQQAALPQATEEPSLPVKISYDDDPVLGQANAPVTLIEFSDYECPFCKRHFTETYPDLKKDYIDTGKVKLIFRDFPLPFHDPLATKEAIAANCAKEQGGDAAYFRYHDELFKRTTSNGNGLTVESLSTIAGDLGLNTANFSTCIASDKYSGEIKKDMADGEQAGISGTPGFFVGKSGDGSMEGTRIVGAVPYEQFKTAIDALLK